MSDSEQTTDWQAVKRYSAMLAALVLAYAGYGIWKSMNKEKAPEVAAAASSASTVPAKRPEAKKAKYASVRSTTKLTIPDSAVTADAVRHHVTEWLEKAWQVSGLTDPVPPHLAQKDWQPFVKALIASETGGPDAVSHRVLRDQALALLPVAGEHPISAYLVGQVLIRDEAGPALLEKAAQGLRDKAGAETLAFHAAAVLALSSTGREDEKVIKERVDSSLKALRKALDAEAGYSKYHDRLAAFLLHDHIRPYFEGLHEQFWAEISKTESVKPWLKKTIEGRHCLQKAWDARGGGYANTVTDDGSAIFSHESEKARRLLQQAWELKPEDPSPAVTLIYSCLSINRNGDPEKQMRRWFDEVLKVQVDHTEAAQHLLWGLRPRWYGSHKKMENIGLACLETERFDSGLPWVLLQAHRDSASEWDVPDEYWQKIFCYDRLKALFDGAEASEKRASWRSLDRSHAAITSFKCGEYEEAQRWLEKLDFKPDARAIESWGIDEAFLIGKTAAFTGESGKKLREAEKAEESVNASSALAIYRDVLKSGSDKLSEAGRAYLETRAALANIEEQLERYETVSLMPDAKFQGWTREGGGWRLKDGVLEHVGREKIQATACEARVGSSFTLTGDVEVVEPGEAAQVWFSHGYPERTDKDRWISLRFVFDGKQTLALLSNGMGQPLEHPVIEVEPRFKFALIANPSGITLRVNDKVAFENVPIPEDFVNEPYTQVGLGAATKSEKTRVKIHSLTVKR